MADIKILAIDLRVREAGKPLHHLVCSNGTTHQFHMSEQTEAALRQPSNPMLSHATALCQSSTTQGRDPHPDLERLVMHIRRHSPFFGQASDQIGADYICASGQHSIARIALRPSTTPNVTEDAELVATGAAQRCTSR